MALTRILFVGTARSALMLCAASSAQQPGGQQYQNTMQQNSNQQGGQGGQLSSQEVHSYFRQSENQISQAVQSGNARQLQQWTQNNIENAANFQAVIQIGGQNASSAKEIRVLSLNKNDMLQRQQVAFSLAPELLNRVQNYDLSIRVINVQPVGNDAAIVKTRISESGTIGRGTGGQFGGNNRSGTQGMGFSEPENEGMNQGFQPGQSGGSRFQAQQELQNGGQSGGNQFMAQNGQGQNQGFQGGGPRANAFPGQGVSFNANAECTQLVERSPNSGHMTIGIANCTGDIQF